MQLRSSSDADGNRAFGRKGECSKELKMVHIRTAGFEDIAAISSILAASWKTAYRGIVNDDYLDLLTDEHWIDFLNTGMNNK